MRNVFFRLWCQWNARVPLPSPIDISFGSFQLVTVARDANHIALWQIFQILLCISSVGEFDLTKSATQKNPRRKKLNDCLVFFSVSEIFSTHLPLCLLLEPHPPSHELIRLSQHECHHCCCVTPFTKCVNWTRTARLQLLGTFLPFFAYL